MGSIRDSHVDLRGLDEKRNLYICLIKIVVVYMRLSEYRERRRWIKINWS